MKKETRNQILAVINIMRTNYQLYEKASVCKETYRKLYEKTARECLWFISEKIDTNNADVCQANYKRHFRQRFWSKAAYEAYSEAILKGKKFEQSIIFEHVVPRVVIAKELTRMIRDKKSDKEILEFLSTFLVVCVVLKEEDNKLTGKYKASLGCELVRKNIWHRYKQVGIEVVKVKAIKEKRKYLVEKLNDVTF